MTFNNDYGFSAAVDLDLTKIPISPPPSRQPQPPQPAHPPADIPPLIPAPPGEPPGFPMPLPVPGPTFPNPGPPTISVATGQQASSIEAAEPACLA